MDDKEPSSQNCRIGKCGTIGEESGYKSQNPKYQQKPKPIPKDLKD